MRIRCSHKTAVCAVPALVLATLLAVPPLARGDGAVVPASPFVGPPRAARPLVAVPIPPVTSDELTLGRAAYAWRDGDVRAAAALLETLDVSLASTSPCAERGAFLLASAYLTLRDGAAFEAVASRAGSATGSPWRQWIHWARTFAGQSSPGTAAPSPFPGADIVTASLLLEAGQAPAALRLLDATTPDPALASLHLTVRALARARSGADPSRDWDALSLLKPASELEADLVARAAFELAGARVAKGQDARGFLERVPANSRLAPRARHTLAMQALAHGDTAAARARLDETLDAHPYYDGRRDLKLALGTMAMDRGHWTAALRYFESADDNWVDERLALDRIASSDSLAWSEWERQDLWRSDVRLAPEAVMSAVLALAGSALNLAAQPSLSPDPDLAKALWPAWDKTPRASLEFAGVLARHTPTPGEWNTLQALRSHRSETAARLARTERDILDREAEIARRLTYLDRGAGRAHESAGALATASGSLDSLVTRLDAVLRELEAVRDTTLAHVASRTREMGEEIRRDALFMRALRHFHVDGPNRDRPQVFPPGVPSTTSLLAREDSLSAEIASFLLLCAERYPRIIHRSFAEVWRPRLLDDSRVLRDRARNELARANRIAVGLDSTRALWRNDAVLAAAHARRTALANTRDSLDVAETLLKSDIASAVAARGRTVLAAEREGIDYPLSDALYELAVAAATDTATAENAEVVRPLRDRAMGTLENFLAHYPGSVARAEARFRLADLALMRARDDFQTRMASFLNDNPAAADTGNRALAPFVDYGPAVALYESILAEDTGYVHRDAVMFNLGMILADDGQARGIELLTAVVRDYPSSPDAQEAWLRIGSDAFEREDYAASVAPFERAAAGAEPSFAAIALYKLGWACFEVERFPDASDAFRRLIDQYAVHPQLVVTMDLRDEAREYLIHSLARAGGAEAFAPYFDSLGQRPYERDVLLGLGHLYRNKSLYGEAIACDELWMTRWPLDASALDAALRVDDTYQRWSKPDLARTRTFVHAAHFLPDGAWHEANSADSVRTRATRFTQRAFRSTAAHYHREARATDAPETWRAALDTYERYLGYWPEDRDARRVHFVAGEAAAQLSDYPRARRHFGTAATSDSTALAADATWHGVAVTDAWYRSSRPAETGNGADSLATLLVRDSRAFAARFPDDPRRADIVWRHGNVSYAHQGYADAAVTLSSFGDRYPADPRAVRAIRMSGDARFRLAEYEIAGQTYERALTLARTTAPDSVVTALERAVPASYYKHAETVAAADTTRGPVEAAAWFARVARDWPRFEHADLALYRAGLGFEKGGRHGDAVTAWETLLTQYPKSSYARDASVEIAHTHERNGDTRAAALAYERFSTLYANDPDAAEALLKSADLLAGAGDETGAEGARTRFLARFPGETRAVMDIQATRARRELAAVSAGQSPTGSALSAYLLLAEKNPELASASILAQMDYLKADALYPDYAAIRLTQPLPASIEKKKARLEALLSAYETCTARGVREYAHASAHRIGEALIEFGDALQKSERPSELSGDDLTAYNDVIAEQSFTFYDRGEQVWSELLRQARTTPDDPGGWVARTQERLWPRLAERFFFQPEVVHPRVAATVPVRAPQTSSTP